MNVKGVRIVKAILLVPMALLYVGSGVLHFVAPAVYAQIMPDYLPWHVPLVYLSGVAELALGVGVLVPRTRRLCAWGLIALLVAVFPANVYMATQHVQLIGLPGWMAQPSETARWVRLPFQLLLVAWAWWYTRAAKHASMQGP